MACWSVHRYSGFSHRLHRLRCPECRAARAVDLIIGRGVAQMQAEPAPPQGLSRTLDALGLRGAEERPVPRLRGTAPRVVGRAAAGIALALLGTTLALTFFGRTDTAVFAETLAALQKVRSYHWTGVQMFNGREQPWEVWYAPGHYREQIGDQTTVDDGVHERRYKAGTRVVIVNRRNLAGYKLMAEMLQPGGFLARLLQMNRDQGWRMQIRHQAGRAHDARPVEQYDITAIPPGKPHRIGVQQVRLTLLIDPHTKLPVGWTADELWQGQWQLNNRVDRIEYNLAIPPQIFELRAPAGARSIEVDHGDRGESQMAAQTTPRGWKIVLRAIDLTREGDVLVTVSMVPPGQARPKPDPVPLGALRDERGIVYADTKYDLMTKTYARFWLTSPAPPPPDGPWPQRFTVTVRVEDGETVTFRDLRAPRPALDSVLQVMPGLDPDQAERIRAEARARLRSRKELGSTGTSRSQLREGAF